MLPTSFMKEKNDVNTFNRAILYHLRSLGTDDGWQTAYDHCHYVLWIAHLQIYATIKEETMDLTCTLLVTLIFMSMVEGIIVMLFDL